MSRNNGSDNKNLRPKPTSTEIPDDFLAADVDPPPIPRGEAAHRRFQVSLKAATVGRGGQQKKRDRGPSTPTSCIKNVRGLGS